MAHLGTPPVARHEQPDEIIIKSTGITIPPHPEGQFAARCIDVIDSGIVTLTYEGRTQQKHRGRIRFFCGQWFETEDGEKRPHWIDKFVTMSLHERSGLRKFLENWRGKKFTKEELKGWNLSQIVGANALVQISHSDNGEYANIDTCMVLLPGIERVPPLEDYVRVKDRPPREDGPVDVNRIQRTTQLDKEEEKLPF